MQRKTKMYVCLCCFWFIIFIKNLLFQSTKELSYAIIIYFTLIFHYNNVFVDKQDAIYVKWTLGLLVLLVVAVLFIIIYRKKKRYIWCLKNFCCMFFNKKTRGATIVRQSIMSTSVIRGISEVIIKHDCLICDISQKSKQEAQKPYIEQ